MEWRNVELGRKSVEADERYEKLVKTSNTFLAFMEEQKAEKTTLQDFIHKSENVENMRKHEVRAEAADRAIQYLMDKLSNAAKT